MRKYEHTVYQATPRHHSYYYTLSSRREPQVNIIDSVMPNSREQGGTIFRGHKRFRSTSYNRVPYIWLWTMWKVIDSTLGTGTATAEPILGFASLSAVIRQPSLSRPDDATSLWRDRNHEENSTASALHWPSCWFLEALRRYTWIGHVDTRERELYHGVTPVTEWQEWAVGFSGDMSFPKMDIYFLSCLISRPRMSPVQLRMPVAIHPNSSIKWIC